MRRLSRVGRHSGRGAVRVRMRAALAPDQVEGVAGPGASGGGVVSMLNICAVFRRVVNARVKSGYNY